ncbi:MAG: helix-turn-helix transcriptional regulator [Klebsiella sp.]|uniref:helix-turn-helix transcriptional regulator n=1 Tax=Klebsiella sp. TaxID=576 RepID=UPI00290EA6CB|nr:helix-turn-helix transcriptional regulator [Klebsiella sp.]MDU3362074.1 helix-turn-helix transcriptional regulator [Klebsiella sp.]
MNTSDNHALGDFLRARRQRLDPATFGFPAGRRRTPGLRREEVAQLASISPTWYTWLEQGRGGAPSREVLERIACGLRLTTPEREHLFILAFGHPPQTRLTVTLPLAERNVLRRLFTRPEARCTLEDWQTVGQLIVNAFRADVTRMGATTETDQLIAELTQQSVEFARFWQSHDVAGHGEGYKRIHHPQMGPLDLEFTSFAVEGRPDLSLLVFNPATTESQRKIHGLLAGAGSSPGAR